ncbi:MAG: FkbM family methyltransferase [Holosporaceae bacterium]|nr:FkbM family methyltransferase [Holosporaceae bacterium]
MTDYSTNQKQEGSFFGGNKIVLFAVIVTSLLFVIVLFIEKSKSVKNMIPMIRGEVSISKDFSITTTKDKFPIIIKKKDPTIGKKLRFSGNVESVFLKTAVSLMKKNDTIVEVGAHFGYNTISIAKKLDNSGKYYAFEPNGTVFSCLRKSVVLNDLSEIVVLKNLAIADKVYSFPIKDCLSKKKSSDGHYTKTREVIVNSSTLDRELAEEHRPISLLLIDIPGLEFSIIKGAETIIANSHDIEIVVYFDRARSAKNFDLETEFQRMKNMGFNFYIAKEANNYEKADISNILSRNESVIVMTRNNLDF